MKIFLLTLVNLAFASICFATPIIVDANGAGQFTTITAGIAAASNNDTVIVWPGTYVEQVSLNKNILLQGFQARLLKVQADADSALRHAPPGNQAGPA